MSATAGNIGEPNLVSTTKNVSERLRDRTNCRIAIVHDCLVHMGGAERVVQSLHAVFPLAPIYSLVVNEREVERMLPGAEVHYSFAQHLPGAARFFRSYSPVLPLAVESFDLTGYDVVISSSHAFAKGVITPVSSCHISYCHSPLRYLWSEYHFHRKMLFRQPWKRIFVDPVLHYLRMWDRLSADRVDHFLANSQTTADRIAKYYRRTSTIIYPPVRVGQIPLAGSPGNYFLLVSRLVSYKRVEIAVRAFNELGLPLKIVGTGPELADLRRQSRLNVEFLGSVSDSTLQECYAGCRALVYPGIEDFGIVMVEAQAHGKPVIACSFGGASEILLDGSTGVLFDEQTPDALMQAIKRLDSIDFDPVRIRNHALEFDESRFKERMLQFILEKWEEHRVNGCLAGDKETVKIP
jgi:glycosyltransferase involved in cell wall biosynthesis